MNHTGKTERSIDRKIRPLVLTRYQAMPLITCTLSAMLEMYRIRLKLYTLCVAESVQVVGVADGGRRAETGRPGREEGTWDVSP